MLLRWRQLNGSGNGDRQIFNYLPNKWIRKWVEGEKCLRRLHCVTIGGAKRLNARIDWI